MSLSSLSALAVAPSPAKAIKSLSGDPHGALQRRMRVINALRRFADAASKEMLSIRIHRIDPNGENDKARFAEWCRRVDPLFKRQRALENLIKELSGVQIDPPIYTDRFNRSHAIDDELQALIRDGVLTPNQARELRGIYA
ncbi:MAG: hypothetical protein FJX40_13850 [Alphaproteobacteria bacterium]|nr:hypothetical protein [Alphaproteobacteria bacterium]